CNGVRDEGRGPAPLPPDRHDRYRRIPDAALTVQVRSLAGRLSLGAAVDAPPYERMIIAVYFALGVCLLFAARDPVRARCGHQRRRWRMKSQAYGDATTGGTRA